MTILRPVLLGTMLGAGAMAALVAGTPAGDYLVPTRRVSPAVATSLQQTAHGMVSLLHYVFLPGGVRVEGVHPKDLQSLGAIIRVTLRGPDGKSRENVEALIDTGADVSFVQKSIINDLGLQPAMDHVQVSEGASSLSSTMAFYRVDVEIPGAVSVPVLMGAVADGGREQMLLGRDVLAKAILVFDGSHNVATLTFSAQ
jgi:predicted aspartyl protease